MDIARIALGHAGNAALTRREAEFARVADVDGIADAAAVGRSADGRGVTCAGTPERNSGEARRTDIRLQIVRAPHAFHRQEAAEGECDAFEVELLVVGRRGRFHGRLRLIDLVLQRFELRGRNLRSGLLAHLSLQVLDLLRLLLDHVLEALDTITARRRFHVVVVLLRRVRRRAAVLREGRCGQNCARSRAQQ